MHNLDCDYIVLQAWDETQIGIFCRGYWEKCQNEILEDKIQMILEKKEIFGIPLILYMVLALDVAIEKSSSIVDVYDQIFSLERGSIYDRCYDVEHRINEPETKKHIHQISQRIAFWIFENNADKAFIYQKNFKEICDIVMLEAEDKSEGIESNTLIGNYFKVKHCEGQMADEVNFIHRSIYEYFVAVYFFESINDLASKEEVAAKLGILLKYGKLSEQILEFIKFKFDSMKGCVMPDFLRKVFQVMLRDGMTYHAGVAFLNAMDREMNIFLNMLEVMFLWNPVLGELDGKVASYLRYNDEEGLKLMGIKLKQAGLIMTNLRQANLSKADLNRAYLMRADLREADLSKADLSGADLSGANLSGADLSGADLSGADLSGADLREADLSEADLIGANLNGADLMEADLSRADLRGAKLNGTRLIAAYLDGADLSRADLNKAELGGVKLNEIDLSNVNLKDILVEEDQVDSLYEKYNLVDIRVNLVEEDEIISYKEYCIRKQQG